MTGHVVIPLFLGSELRGGKGSAEDIVRLTVEATKKVLEVKIDDEREPVIDKTKRRKNGDGLRGGFSHPEGRSLFLIILIRSVRNRRESPLNSISKYLLPRLDG